MDEAIAQLVSITSCTPEVAAQYVQLADGDANQAVTLYFENGGADLAFNSASASDPAASTSRTQGTGDPSNPIDLDDDEPTVTGYQPQHTSSNAEDDEAMARRLQDEMYSNQEEPIRAPIARQAETLLGPGADAPMSGSMLDEAIQERMIAMQHRQRRVARGIFNQRETSSIWRNEDSEASPSLSAATGGASEASARSNMLARLFQPPWDLMFKGEWEEARDEGKEDKKWLLVNIQDGSIFDCQALNRDLWKNESVIDTVKENFIFLQYSKDDPRAGPYTQYYFQNYDNPDSYPHVAIVDPRTGEQVKVWSRKVPPPSEFLMQLHEFLDRYSLDNTARNPVAKRKSESQKEKSVDEMSEEEMMERALQASMATKTDELKPPNAEDPDDLTRSVGDVQGAPRPASDNSDTMSIYENGAAKEVTPFSQIPSDHPHIEPAQGEGITRLQIRHPAGRVVRRFAQADPVSRIYEFLKAEPLEGKGGVGFELVSMGKNLMESRTETIETAGLKNGTVMVEFVDD